MTYDVSGNGKTVLKANYGSYWWNPGADFVFNISPNASAWWRRYRWTDTNNDNRWQPGEEGAQTDARGGAATESLDPEPGEHATRKEFATFVERELMANFGVRAGYVWRGQRNQYGRYNINRPYSAFTVPVSVPDPGPDGRVGNADDGAPIAGVRPGAGIPRAAVGQPDDQRRRQRRRLPHVRNHRHQAHEQPLEPAGVVRLDEELRPGRHDPGQRDSRQRAAGEPERRDQHRGRAASVYTRSTVKLNGTWNSPFWDISFSPMMRYQQGIPFGRTFARPTLSYGSVRFLAEPLGTRRQDAI